MLSQFGAWQEWVFRVSLCTLGTFRLGQNGIEYDLAMNPSEGF
jgi:hypothetical protein